MSDVRHLRASDSRRVPWKNGRGSTEELALWPAGASFEKGDFDWRISKASVVEDGPFSLFPGFERVLLVTEGKGLVLDHGAHAPRTELGPLVPYRFSGDWPTRAELVAGRVADFNVLCRRGVVRAEVEVWQGRVEHELRATRTEQDFVHVLEGTLEARASDGGSWSLAPGESLWAREAAGLDLRARGTVIRVRILAL